MTERRDEIPPNDASEVPTMLVGHIPSQYTLHRDYMPAAQTMEALPGRYSRAELNAEANRNVAGRNTSNRPQSRAVSSESRTQRPIAQPQMIEGIGFHAARILEVILLLLQRCLLILVAVSI